MIQKIANQVMQDSQKKQSYMGDGTGIAYAFSYFT